MEATKVKSPLVQKTIRVTPVLKNNGWLPKGHDGQFLFTGSVIRYSLIYDPSRRQYVDPLTPEEREWFESEESGLGFKRGTLSLTKTDSKQTLYWETLEVVIDKNGMDLNLNEPIDYLRYKLLKTNAKWIAPDLKSQNKKPSYKFALVDQDDEIEVKVMKSDNKKRAYIEFGRMEDSFDKMLSFCLIYQREYGLPNGKLVSKNTSKDTLIAAIDEIVDKHTEKFLDIISNSNFTLAANIERAIAGNIITMKDNIYKFETKTLGSSMAEVISYFNSPKNNTDMVKLMNKLEVNK